MAASLLMASSFFVGRVRRLRKGWSFAATQSSGDSAYSPECVEGAFPEVHLTRGLAAPPPGGDHSTQPGHE